MLAHVKTAPPTREGLPPRLQVIADALTELDTLWLLEQLELGRDPPCCSHCATAPWVPGGRVQYIEHHGAALGEGRLYLDAPSMFAAARGTCIDIAAYDCACRRVRGERCRTLIVPLDHGQRFHCVVQLADGTLLDVTEAWNTAGCACGS